MSEKNITSKSDLIEKIATEQNIPKAYVKTLMDAIPSAITDELKEGKKVQWMGFGTFEVTERKGRTGRNPATGEEIYIQPSKSIKFAISNNMKKLFKQ